MFVLPGERGHAVGGEAQELVRAATAAHGVGAVLQHHLLLGGHGVQRQAAAQLRLLTGAARSPEHSLPVVRGAWSVAFIPRATRTFNVEPIELLLRGAGYRRD